MELMRSAMMAHLSGMGGEYSIEEYIYNIPKEEEDDYFTYTRTFQLTATDSKEFVVRFYDDTRRLVRQELWCDDNVYEVREFSYDGTESVIGSKNGKDRENES